MVIFGKNLQTYSYQGIKNTSEIFFKGAKCEEKYIGPIEKALAPVVDVRAISKNNICLSMNLLVN